MLPVVVRIVVLAAVLLFALATLGVARAQPRTCGTRSLGPGAVTHVTGGGARCLLDAYRARCRPARYVLSLFGVDTIATRTFTVARAAGGCRVLVTVSFHIVPQPAHVTGHGFCRKLVTRGKAIVAEGCTGSGLTPAVSLTSAR
jgi:hypothetical protein